MEWQDKEQGRGAVRANFEGVRALSKSRRIIVEEAHDKAYALLDGSTVAGSNSGHPSSFKSIGMESKDLERKV